MSTQIHERRSPLEVPPRIRTMLTLSVASGVLHLAPAATGVASFTTTLQFRNQMLGSAAWSATIVTGVPIDVLQAVAAGGPILGVTAPAEFIARGYRGEAPFSAPLDIRRVFSFPEAELICSAGAPDDFVTAACGAIASRRSELGLAPDADVRDSFARSGGNDVPLHPAAERFWFAPAAG